MEVLKPQWVIKLEGMERRVGGILVETHRYNLIFGRPTL